MRAGCWEKAKTRLFFLWQTKCMASPLPSSSTFPNMILFLPYLFYGLRLNNKIDEAFRTKGLDFQTDVARRRQKKCITKFLIDRQPLLCCWSSSTPKNISALKIRNFYSRNLFFFKESTLGGASGYFICWNCTIFGFGSLIVDKVPINLGINSIAL